MRYKGQIAAITGGAEGIGKAISKRLASEGAHVVILDRDEEKGEALIQEIKSTGGEATFTFCDVSSHESVTKAFASIDQNFHQLDIMVNSAGVSGPGSTPIEDVSVETFQHVLNVNLLGSFLTCRAALPIMKKSNYGRILLIASIAGKEGNAGMVSYSASKAGVIGLCKSVGKECAETGITVNALAPAVIQTPLVDGLPPSQVKYMTDKIPAKRCGTLDEIAATVAFIVSPECSFNNGFTFDLSGGRATY